jgi:hypothetical protein
MGGLWPVVPGGLPRSDEDSLSEADATGEHVICKMHFVTKECSRAPS